MKNKTKIITSLLGVTAFMSLAVMGGLAKGQKQQFTPALAEEPEVLYSEDFSGDTMPAGWNATFTLQDGKAVYNAADPWATVPIPSTAWVESNNYDISFDLHYDSSNISYFHLCHLDGSAADRNIFLALVNGGEFWRLANFGDFDIYDNSGDDQGCNYILPELRAKMKDTSIRVRFLILDDVIEVHADDRRLIAVPMAAFGNNRYSSRRSIVKGILDGFAINFECAANACWIDNFVMKEAKYGDSYFFHANEETAGTYYLPLTYENLYHNSFTMKADFMVHRSLVTDGSVHAYPRFGLIMNQIIPQTDLSEPTNSINAQNYLDREFQTPWVGGISPTTGNWSGQGGDYAAANYEDTRYTQTVDVIGDRIIFTVKTNQEGDHQVSKFETSFTALGLTKGKLLTALVGNSYTNVSNIEFFGYEGNYGIKGFMENNRYFVGQNVMASAKVFGDTTGAEGFVWKLDGVATEQTGLEFNAGSAIAAGEHTLVYGNSTVSSEELKFEVLENMITISADKEEMYPIDTATISAVVEGAIASADVRWKVNNVQVQGAEGPELVLSDLEAGEYKIVAFVNDVVSNELTLTVKAPSLKIAAAKGSYAKTETATVTATALGIAGSDTIKWFANDVELEGKTGTTLELAMAAYEQAGEVEIQAKTQAAESNKIKLFIIKDIYAEISADPNWKEAYKQEIEAGSTFGAYAAVEDPDGNYYAPQNSGSGNDAQFPAMAIETQSWSMEYDLLIPESVSTYGGEYYVYPQAMGMDSRNPTDWIELAVAVGASSLRTYVKTHAAGVIYEYADFNTGKDLSYAGGIAHFGWNHIVYAMQGNTAAFYINNELVFYASIPNSTVPSGFCMSMYPGSGGAIPLGYKNFTVKGIVVPPPVVSGVSVNASKVSAKVGDSVTLSATVNPYNATYETIEWYVNGQKVEGANALTYVLTPTAAGEYSVVCKIDGIQSAAKVITFAADTPSDGGDQGGSEGEEPAPAKKGCRSSIIATSALISITALAGFGILLSKKRKER